MANCWSISLLYSSLKKSLWHQGCFRNNCLWWHRHFQCFLGPKHTQEGFSSCYHCYIGCEINFMNLFSSLKLMLIENSLISHRIQEQLLIRQCQLTLSHTIWCKMQRTKLFWSRLSITHRLFSRFRILERYRSYCKKLKKRWHFSTFLWSYTHI